MSIWETIARTAVLGVERQGFSLVSDGTPLGVTLAGLRHPEPEQNLLLAAGATTLYRKVGTLPAESATTLPVCPPEVLLPCSEPMVRGLRQIVRGSFGAILPEWLALATKTGRYVPPSFLPELFKLARSKAEIRPALVPVLGKRGRWLADLNPDWKFMQDGTAEFGNPEEVWCSGEPDQRLKVLKFLRATDPRRGFALVEQTWKDETPSTRSQICSALYEGLHATEEPFLEAALDDTKLEVRQKAADMLALLPNSHLSQRMQVRLERCFAFQPEPMPEFTLELPDECDASAMRDGIIAKAPTHLKIGLKQWWFRQMLERVPPSHWSRRTGLKPEKLVALVRASEWSDLILAAWQRAVLRFRESDWVLPLLPDKETEYHWVAELVAALPPHQREPLVIQEIEKHLPMVNSSFNFNQLLRTCPFQWSDEMSRIMVTTLGKRFRKIKKEDKARDWSTQQLLETIALYLKPQYVTEIERDWPTEIPVWEKISDVVDQFVTTLKFRCEIHAAFEVIPVGTQHQPES